jgi:Peptidase family M28
MTRTPHLRSIRIGLLAAGVMAALAAQPWTLLAQGPQPAKGVKYAQISPAEMKEWLTYLSSDELLGRQIYTEGFGMAAQYISEHLRQWGVKPLNSDGTYFQPVKSKGYKVTRNSTVTLTLPDGAKTFKQGDHVTFSANSGGSQTVNYTGVEFVGYGDAAELQGRDLKDKLVVIVPNLAQAGGGGGFGRGGRGGRGGGASAGAIAAGATGVVTFAAAPEPLSANDKVLLDTLAGLVKQTDALTTALRGGGRGRGGFTDTQVEALTAAGLTPAQIAALSPAGGGRGGGRGQTLPASDLTSLQRVDALVTPQFTGDDTFFEALFSAAPTKFDEIKAKAEKGDPIAPMSLPVRASVQIDNTFDVISEQISHNVVGMVEGTDPTLKNTYVLFGAHLDHIGYSQTGGGSQPTMTSCRARSPIAVDALEAAGKKAQNPRSLDTKAAAAAAAAGGGRGRGGFGGRGAVADNPTPFDQRDFISNGADDDGSGSTSLLAVAKAFATGPKPKRSVVFVWHTGEEAGLNGSRYNADFPVVPLDKVQAQLNMDMVGRDDCDDVEGDYSNTVFIVGADRISTDLHNIIVETNDSVMAKPLKLDYELNDPADPESVYTRSDHYSYAAKGIPIAFFTTGLHEDYHKVSDTVDKILFPKMARIAQLVYETGFGIASTDKVLVRDNKGPRTGFGSKAEIIKK